MEISGAARVILSAERVALNFVQRLSGVATLTSQFIEGVTFTFPASTVLARRRHRKLRNQASPSHG